MCAAHATDADERHAPGERERLFRLYIARSDVLAGAPLGQLDISADGVLIRDEKVFAKTFAAGARLVMTFSGGYQKSNAPLIARSILNLEQKFGLSRRAANHSSP